MTASFIIFHTAIVLKKTSLYSLDNSKVTPTNIDKYLLHSDKFVTVIYIQTKKTKYVWNIIQQRKMLFSKHKEAGNIKHPHDCIFVSAILHILCN